jgi:hypothetical protein
MPEVNKNATGATGGQAHEEQAAQPTITADMWREALREGDELRRVLEAQVRPMQTLTADDLKARSR